MLSMVNGLGLCCRCCRWLAIEVAVAKAVVVWTTDDGDREWSVPIGDVAPSTGIAIPLLRYGGGGSGRGGQTGNGRSGCESVSSKSVAAAAADEDVDDRPNVASNRARSAAGSLNRLRRRRNDPFSNMSRASGCSVQYAPLPGWFGRRGIFMKQSLNDRLCRSEFCHLKHGA